MPSSDENALELMGQHRLIIERSPNGDALRLIAPDGSAPITIEITSAGVKISLSAPNIALEAQGALSLSADRLTLEGRNGLTLSSGGDLDLQAARQIQSRSQEHIIRAEHGGVNVKATDDVRLSGERVMVNCDETVDRYFRPPNTQRVP